jgi:hypothetical protein
MKKVKDFIFNVIRRYLKNLFESFFLVFSIAGCYGIFLLPLASIFKADFVWDFQYWVEDYIDIIDLFKLVPILALYWTIKGKKEYAFC